MNYKILLNVRLVEMQRQYCRKYHSGSLRSIEKLQMFRMSMDSVSEVTQNLTNDNEATSKLDNRIN